MPAADGRPLASGRDADVWARPGGLVLRRYRDGRTAQPVADLLRTLAGLGMPVPRVESCSGPDLVMEHVVGPTLAEAMATGTVPVDTAAVALADLHRVLHGLPWPAAGPGEALLHLDLHPLNVLWSPRGPVVIDWDNARPGPPGLDAATTALVLSQVALGGPGAEAVAPELVREFLRHFLTAAYAGVAEHLATAVDLRRADRYQTEAELTGLGAAADLVVAVLPGPDAGPRRR